MKKIDQEREINIFLLWTKYTTVLSLQLTALQYQLFCFSSWEIMHCFLVDENLFLPKHFCILGFVLSHDMFK